MRLDIRSDWEDKLAAPALADGETGGLPPPSLAMLGFAAAVPAGMAPIRRQSGRR